MGKIIINECNPFFEMEGKEGDVMYSFTGKCGPMSWDNVLYGKTINLSDMYNTILDGVREFLFGGGFVNSDEYNDSNNNKGIACAVNKYTKKKYGISMENVYNKIQNNSPGKPITSPIIFNELKNRYGMDGIDWMYLYDNVGIFRIYDCEILEYLGNRLLNNDIHKYFVTNYNLRTMGVVKKVKSWINKNNVSVDRFDRSIKMEWDNGGSKNIKLSNFMINYNRWWHHMTGRTDRSSIRDYDVLLNGKSVTDVFPVYCPVFNNLRMNYTGIDFDGKNNIKKCSEIAGYSDKGETWSAASIDRIDSNKGYSYDNIRIISHYANHLKNVGNIEQMRRLVRYMDKQNSYF
jgi:hypothetical protein